jgi:hypothetical protein
LLPFEQNFYPFFAGNPLSLPANPGINPGANIRVNGINRNRYVVNVELLNFLHVVR